MVPSLCAPNSGFCMLWTWLIYFWLLRVDWEVWPMLECAEWILLVQGETLRFRRLWMLDVARDENLWILERYARFRVDFWLFSFSGFWDDVIEHCDNWIR